MANRFYVFDLSDDRAACGEGGEEFALFISCCTDFSNIIGVSVTTIKKLAVLLLWRCSILFRICGLITHLYTTIDILPSIYPCSSFYRYHQ